MNGALAHFRSRLSATLRDPSALLVMLGSGLFTLVLWPGAMPASGPTLPALPGESLPPAIAIMLVGLWLWLWPMLPATTIGGRAVVANSRVLSLRPHPPLPASARARVLAEATLVMLFVLLARAPVILLGDWLRASAGAPDPTTGSLALGVSFITDTVVGMAVALPVVVAWMSSTASPQELLVRSAATVVLEVSAMAFGLLADAPRAILTGASLTALQLALVDREIILPRMGRRDHPPATNLTRRFRPPHRQLIHDFWARPLPLAVTLLALHIALVVADTSLHHPWRLLGHRGPGALLFASTIVMGLALGFVALRPLASSLAIAGLVGMPGTSSGDMIAAWAVLPVRRESVLRGVYLHGLLTTLTIWAVVVATLVATAWFDHGGLTGHERQLLPLKELILPYGAVAPCIAGMLAAAAAGCRRKAMIAALAMVFVFHGHPILLILGTPPALHAAILALATGAGALPILTDLRRPGTGRRGPAPSAGS